MTTTETKLDALTAAIRHDIAACDRAATESMATLGKIKPNLYDFKKANRLVAANAYAAFYLRYIETDVTSTRDIERAERLIRFHAYQQKKMRALDNNSVTAPGQYMVVNHLDSYVTRFFE